MQYINVSISTREMRVLEPLADTSERIVLFRAASQLPYLFLSMI